MIIHELVAESSATLYLKVSLFHVICTYYYMQVTLSQTLILTLTI